MSLGRKETKGVREESWKNKTPAVPHFLGSYFSFSIKYYNHLKYFLYLYLIFYDFKKFQRILICNIFYFFACLS